MLLTSFPVMLFYGAIALEMTSPAKLYPYSIYWDNYSNGKSLKNRDMAYLKMFMCIVFGPMGCSVRLSNSIF